MQLFLLNSATPTRLPKGRLTIVPTYDESEMIMVVPAERWLVEMRDAVWILPR